MTSTTSSKIDIVIPIGRRIGEIMEEKGDAFSIRAFAARLGMSKDMLSRCINGDRYIKPSELEKISKGLNLSVQRLKREDTRQVQEELGILLDTIKNANRAIYLANQLVSVAVGISEKSYAFIQLGRSYYMCQKYESAHDAWLQAYESAQLMAKKYDEFEVLHQVLNKLMISYSIRKEFSRMAEIIDEVEPFFQNDPSRWGAICYSVAMASYDRNEYEKAREKLYESFDQYSKTQDAKSIGMAQRNVAYIEYKLGNYRTAREFFELAIDNLVQDEYWRMVAIKDYVKNLIKMGELEAAENQIESSLRHLEKLEYTELRAKFYLLLGRAKNEVSYFEELLNQNEVGKNVHQLACKYLMNHFSRVGNAESLLKYYKLAEGLVIKHCDILEDDAL